MTEAVSLQKATRSLHTELSVGKGLHTQKVLWSKHRRALNILNPLFTLELKKSLVKLVNKMHVETYVGFRSTLR